MGGHGYGTDVQVLLAEYLFSQTSINRLEAGTDVDTFPKHGSLEDKAGFPRQGVARGCQYRAGAYHDLVVYARTRADS